LFIYGNNQELLIAADAGGSDEEADSFDT